MENQGADESGKMEDEEFPEEFQCCVCLDILYKPVVLACGHISCFWCVFKAMNTWQESHCPVCRKPYNHFPRICELMHFLLLKLYPSSYLRRGKQVAEEEKGYGHTSPQFDDQFNEVLNNRDSPSAPLVDVPIKSNSLSGVDNLFIQNSSKRIICGEEHTTAPVASSSQKINGVLELRKHDLLTDLQCAVCKQLLFRPVVLNCGHVYCQACTDQDNSVCRCPKCQSAHPNGFPDVCLVLEQFLEKQFPDEYSARKEYIRNSQCANPSTGSKQKQEQATESFSPSSSTAHGRQFHRGVGCDYCGMCPIIGQRYKCKDCVEKIGFDLCESCYNSSSKQPGRFNQQHTPEHQFMLVPLPSNTSLQAYAAVVHLSNDYGSEDEDLEVISSLVNGGRVVEHNIQHSPSVYHFDDELETITIPSPVNGRWDLEHNIRHSPSVYHFDDELETITIPSPVSGRWDLEHNIQHSPSVDHSDDELETIPSPVNGRWDLEHNIQHYPSVYHSDDELETIPSLVNGRWDLEHNTQHSPSNHHSDARNM